MKNAGAASPGWYPSPLSRKPGFERWWDGTAWTTQTRLVSTQAQVRSASEDQLDARSQIAPLDPLPAIVNGRLSLAGFALAACTLFLLLFNFGILAVGVVEFLCALATIGLGGAQLVERLRGRRVRVIVALLEVLVGICGVAWFVQTAVVALNVAHLRH